MRVNICKLDGNGNLHLLNVLAHAKSALTASSAFSEAGVSYKSVSCLFFTCKHFRVLLPASGTLVPVNPTAAF